MSSHLKTSNQNDWGMKNQIEYTGPGHGFEACRFIFKYFTQVCHSLRHLTYLAPWSFEFPCNATVSSAWYYIWTLRILLLDTVLFWPLNISGMMHHYLTINQLMLIYRKYYSLHKWSFSSINKWFPDNSARGQLGPWTARSVADNSARTKRTTRPVAESSSCTLRYSLHFLSCFMLILDETVLF